MWETSFKGHKKAKRMERLKHWSMPQSQMAAYNVNGSQRKTMAAKDKTSLLNYRLLLLILQTKKPWPGQQKY